MTTERPDELDEPDELELAAEAERKAEIERGGRRWAIGAGIALAAVVGLCIWNGSKPSVPTGAELSSDAQRACQEQFIPDRLKAPATAKFTGVTVSDSGGTYTVTGSVDSQNGFGALIRSTFTCVMHSSADKWVLDSANVDG